MTVEGGDKIPKNGIKGLEDIDRSKLPDREQQEVQGSVELDNIEKEKSPERELAKKWAKKWLPWEVLDAYALSYENSRKSNEEKRKNQKYQKHLQKAEKDYIPYLVERLTTQLESRKLDEETSEEEIKEVIIKIFKSGRHLKNMVSAIKQHQYEVSQQETVVSDTLEKATEMPKGEEELSDNKTEDKKKSVLDVPETEKEFFKKYDKVGSYINPKTSEEFKILKYNPSDKEVTIHKEQRFSYDRENEAWGIREGGEKKTVKFSDFIDLMRSYVSDNEYFQQEKETQQEQTQEKEPLGGLYVNEKGEWFKLKEYQKEPGKKRHTSQEGRVLIEQVNGQKKEAKMTIDDFNDFVGKNRINFFRNEQDLLDSFRKEFEDYHDLDNFKIENFSYNEKKKRYLAKIQKDGEKQLVTVKELREIVKNPESKKENENDLSNYFEQNEIDFIDNVLRDYVKDYQKELREYLEDQKDILGEKLSEEIGLKYKEHFWKKVLVERLNSIEDIIPQNKQEIVYNYLQNQFK